MHQHQHHCQNQLYHHILGHHLWWSIILWGATFSNIIIMIISFWGNTCDEAAQCNVGPRLTVNCPLRHLNLRLEEGSYCIYPSSHVYNINYPPFSSPAPAWLLFSNVSPSHPSSSSSLPLRSQPWAEDSKFKPARVNMAKSSASSSSWSSSPPSSL